MCIFGTVAKGSLKVLQCQLQKLFQSPISIGNRMDLRAIKE